MYACVDYISYFLFLQLRLTMKSNANVDLLHEVHVSIKLRYVNTLSIKPSSQGRIFIEHFCQGKWK